jgi:hypothetical protein
VSACEHAPRAPRYAIPLTVLFRTEGEHTWLEGRTENISTSGVLVRADRRLEPDTCIEILLNIPADVPGLTGGSTMCRGRTVRALGPTPHEYRPAFAAMIVGYETAHVTDPRRI